MSEALSSSEIEDVLSSIRRLVSEDMRPVPKGTTAAVVEGEKLLLTPALRVVQSDSTPAPAVEPGLDALVLTVGAGMAQHSQDWESEMGDMAPIAEPASFPEGELAAQDWEDHQIDAYTDNVLQPALVEDILVEVVEDAEFTSSGQILSFADAAGGEPLPGWAQSSGAEAAEDAQPEPSTTGTVEPDPAWADQAEAAVLQELAGAGPTAQLGVDEIVLNDTAEEDTPDIPVDAAMLREIVREVLREELQGRLGERITRNIRKLVRAEIARVMASEEFL